MSEAPMPGQTKPEGTSVLSSVRLDFGRIAASVAAPAVGAVAGLALGAVLILLSGANPIAAYRSLALGALGGPRQLTDTILETTPLLIMGLGLMVAFRSRAWNIGGAGQFYIGALCGILVGLTFQGTWPAYLLIPAMLVAGAAGGALWAGIAAFLKVSRGINEIITTLMLNYIAEFLILYLARGPMREQGSYLPQSAQLVGPARMPTLPGSQLHLGILIGIVFIPATYVLLWRTPLGFRLRAIGSNQGAARYAGMGVAAGIGAALLISGALAGLTGITQVSALYPRLKDGIAADYGFTGILVALLGRLSPVGVAISAFFFAALTIGAEAMQTRNGLPNSIAEVIQALVVLLVLAGDALARYRRK